MYVVLYFKDTMDVTWRSFLKQFYPGVVPTALQQEVNVKLYDWLRSKILSINIQRNIFLILAPTIPLEDGFLIHV